LQAHNAGDRFRALQAISGIVAIPGTHNGLAAQQAKAAGFGACYLSGAAMAAKIAAAFHARRHSYIIARTDAVASEGMDGAVARAKLYIAAGADATFPEALISAEMFREFACRTPGVPLLANMTEFGRTPFYTYPSGEPFNYPQFVCLS
jgi:2-methylisocitrate lyase-like PEP mutase family enzyme